MNKILKWTLLIIAIFLAIYFILLPTLRWGLWLLGNNYEPLGVAGQRWGGCLPFRFWGPGTGLFTGGLMMFGMFLIPLLLIGLTIWGINTMTRKPQIDPVSNRACLHCGKILQSGWVACPYCGEKL